MKPVTISPREVRHIASLTKIPIDSEGEQKFAKAFNATLAVVDKLFSIDISSAPETHQVTGLTSVLQEDEIDSESMLAQEEALANAPRSHNGFFVVDQVIEQE